jgi:hypothetical protein
MNTLVAEKWVDKGQFSLLVEAICRDFRQHDDKKLKKLVEWQKQIKPPPSCKDHSDLYLQLHPQQPLTMNLEP